MKRLLTFALLSFVMGHAAQAAVIYSGLQNLAIPTTFDGVYVNLDNASTSSSAITGWDINPFFGGAGLANSAAFQPARTGTGSTDPVVNFSAGDLISGGLFYASGFGGSGDPASHLGTGTGQFAVGQEGYLGFRFTTDASAGPYYGWMRVIFTNNSAGGLIEDWSYDNTGAPISIPASAAPEPGRGLLLLCAGIVVCLRRRRMPAGGETAGLRVTPSRNF
ncbi:hypothetical protein [Prosthecobacter sp.]|uniref:hypothetical protein n=1 Tax=Prosthecobacter sp. TaxID=1965333 RepID=UPI003783C9A2